MSHPMAYLENPPENPCFGCGPRHARGLRLAFERVGDEVRATYAPKEDKIGWPGLFHTGLHFTVLFEASYWAALELTGRVHVATGPQTYDQQRLPRVGAPFLVAARLVAGPEGGVRTLATSATAQGKPLARLETAWRPYSREQAERAGLPLPDYLLESMAP